MMEGEKKRANVRTDFYRIYRTERGLWDYGKSLETLSPEFNQTSSDWTNKDGTELN